MNKIIELNEGLIEESKKALKEIPFSKTVVKLMVIVALGENSISKVSELFGFSRNTLKSWVRGFSKHGIKGLEDKPRAGKKPKLTDFQQKYLLQLAGDYKEGYTLTKLKYKVAQKYGIEVHETTIFRILKKHGFSYITPRPKHYKQDENQVQEFKKKSIRNYKKQPE
jgi:transposase